jgi:hypothetical protein
MISGSIRISGRVTATVDELRSAVALEPIAIDVRVNPGPVRHSAGARPSPKPLMPQLGGPYILSDAVGAVHHDRDGPRTPPLAAR